MSDKNNNVDAAKKGNFTFLAAAGTGAGGRNGRHHNPVNTPIATPEDLEKVFVKYGCKTQKDLILHLSHSEGLTDGAILKTLVNLVPGCEKMLQPQIYQKVDQSMKEDSWLRRRIMMHREKGHAVKITEGSYAAAATKIYEELDRKAA